jgi:hypothetical protein
MTARRLLVVAATGVAATTLVFAGCGSSSDTTASTTAATAAATADTTASVDTTATTATTGDTVKQVDCMGAEEACSVKIPIGGGASNQAYEVALTGTNLGEPTVTPSEADEEGAYEISDATFTTGGSVYSFTLNAVESLPESAYITLDFATKK